MDSFYYVQDCCCSSSVCWCSSSCRWPTPGLRPAQKIHFFFAADVAKTCALLQYKTCHRTHSKHRRVVKSLVRSTVLLLRNGAVLDNKVRHKNTLLSFLLRVSFCVKGLCLVLLFLFLLLPPSSSCLFDMWKLENEGKSFLV